MKSVITANLPLQTDNYREIDVGLPNVYNGKMYYAPFTFHRSKVTIYLVIIGNLPSISFFEEKESKFFPSIYKTKFFLHTPRR